MKWTSNTPPDSQGGGKGNWSTEHPWNGSDRQVWDSERRQTLESEDKKQARPSESSWAPLFPLDGEKEKTKGKHWKKGMNDGWIRYSRLYWLIGEVNDVNSEMVIQQPGPQQPRFGSHPKLHHWLPEALQDRGASFLSSGRERPRWEFVVAVFKSVDFLKSSKFPQWLFACMETISDINMK